MDTPNDLAAVTAEVQELLNAAGRKYTVKADRIAAYLKVIADNEDYAALTDDVVKSALTGRVPRELTEKFAPTYADLKPNWHWLRGILATLAVERGL